MEYSDILFEKENGIAIITINRPKVLNSFRRQTVEELIMAFEAAGQDPNIGVILLTGTGDRAFCVGGDVKEWGPSGYDGSSWIDIGLPVVRLQELIRSVPKPVIAVVNGYAIGGGHVLQVVCDLAISSENAIFGQAGPKVGSFDAGYGTAYLARLVGERKAREIWMLCRQYTAEEALQMGLINKIVESSALMDEARKWANEILRLSPSALKMIKASFNADTDHIHGLTKLAFGALNFFYATPESNEGHQAFIEKRAPDFSEFRDRGENL
ncbi:1,4-dihydroxy-2-naphthoyl-CoA synthase [Paenibacillus sp. EPM92]|uniref:1,4-dihydroxy-2-naphthoyl-CoA synthase n=1 Tax=Paenibacillus sp. EPM92 TaxID=1561195 RepID=UPI0019165B65|nr:1,4-dihydroxy-2-naphthoyl-CoA synthase [Paenibacillus sp. EPM92]